MLIKDLNYSKLVTRYPNLKVCEESIVRATNELLETFRRGGKLIVFGNGGSACDAEHLCGELQKGFLSPRKLSDEQRDIYNKVDPVIADSLQQGLPAISLSPMMATQSAFANDVDPTFGFAQQVHVLASESDLVMGISTSGNSPNVVNALKVAKAKGVFSIALTGEKPNRCEEYASVTIKAPRGIVHEIQELHLPIYHAICLEIENYFYN
ncbi:MAG: SIS domain-containing protein [Halobacteriovoraceae bacterium]|nr:SIS domain-containing protein [Halobacteriovoraceae bacterium]